MLLDQKQGWSMRFVREYAATNNERANEDTPTKMMRTMHVSTLLTEPQALTYHNDILCLYMTFSAW